MPRFNNYLLREFKKISLPSEERKVCTSITLTNGILGLKRLQHNYLEVKLPFSKFKTTRIATNIRLKKKTKEFYRTLFKTVYTKFKYIGKSYRIRFKKNVIFFKFNRAHRTTYMGEQDSLIIFKRKWFSLRDWSAGKRLETKLSTMYYVRKRNLFTQRGFWSTKQIVYKKEGKVSGYR